jgi:sRNA-binding carbon storage regulator CsrA
MLKLDIKPGDRILIGDVAVVTLEQKSGQTARLAVQADKSVKIRRVAANTGAADAAKEGLPALA